MDYKILIVEDERDVAGILEGRLVKEGYAVAAAYDGEEALARVKADNPDIILLDLMLPKLNGFEVLKELRGSFRDKWRPVIIISAKHELDSVKKGYDLEADHYLTKPCSMENILQAIETMISLIPIHQN
jgi:DNA-binding response OmpR family regulator